MSPDVDVGSIQMDTKVRLQITYHIQQSIKKEYFFKNLPSSDYTNTARHGIQSRRFLMDCSDV